MQLQKVIALTIAIGTSAALAHSPPRPDPRYGGRVVIVERLHLELVVDANAATLHVLDPGRLYLRVPATEARVTFLWADGVERLELRPDGEGRLNAPRTRADTTPLPKVLVQVVAGGRTVHATFRPSAPGARKG